MLLLQYILHALSRVLVRQMFIWLIPFHCSFGSYSFLLPPPRSSLAFLFKYCLSLVTLTSPLTSLSQYFSVFEMIFFVVVHFSDLD